NMFGKERLEKMKDGAILLNVGRGSIVNTEALCDVLISGKLSGAGLDVTDPEPLPSSSRLWKIPTALLTPHVSGGYHLEATREHIVGIFKENLRRFLKEEQMNNAVDFGAGYVTKRKKV
ncbi:MAG: NAD(P)-dependent oxidoreductase, partial [Oscillospiraceae bacterium]